ncbi:hypothetical protein, conserved [Trypanosoma brucei brucei TREU927]|uniref:Uncharacterized protein n=1 Tax=Trypanosoma brucei brucei (strain 927/4 GUTat10.1) TaxID=185431 RepID=Q382J6_TRYB2|nr:hypothetical protein, conserved [Trypanosoma brucei brucei TREU927]EAN80285.1 hypothetical protein, conserved [Trypanosoma brucei brucei TREU927]
MWTPRSDGCTTAERLRAARRRETAKLYENTYELRRRGYICDESGATNACHRRALENKEGNRSGCVTEEVADIRHQEPAADVMVSIDEGGSIKEGECQNVEGPQGLYTTGSFRRTSTVSVSTVEQPIKLLDAAWSRYDTQQVPRWSVSGRKADKHRKNRAPTLSRPSSGPFVRSHMGSASSSKRVGAAPSTALPARLNCFPHVPNPSEGTSVPPSTSATTVSLTPASGKVGRCFTPSRRRRQSCCQPRGSAEVQDRDRKRATGVVTLTGDEYMRVQQIISRV